jgi:hypothetical protein
MTDLRSGALGGTDADNDADNNVDTTDISIPFMSPFSRWHKYNSEYIKTQKDTGLLFSSEELPLGFNFVCPKT